MWFSSQSHDRQPSLSREPRGAHGSPRRRTNFRPRAEALDERCLLSTLTVMNTNDSGAGSLRAEIAAARNGDSIVFTSSLNGQTINLTSGELVINKSLRVQGPGAGQLTISGGGLSRVLEVDYAKKQSVIVSGLTLENGFANAGGGILNNGTLTLNGCTLTGNDHTVAGGQIGGAILNSGTLTISGCTIAGSAANQGGGIYNSNSLTISNSTLSGNSATDMGQGGAIYNGGSMTISNSTLSGNRALMGYDFNEYGEGGAIYEYYGSLTLSNSTLSDNSAPYSYLGSAIYMYGSSSEVTVTGCTLTDSNTSDINLVWVDGGTLTVKNSDFNNLHFHRTVGLMRPGA
jgi:predicted outer membrane repeat protein